MGHFIIPNGGVHLSQRGRYCRQTQSKVARPSKQAQWVVKACAPAITIVTKINDQSSKVMAQTIKVNKSIQESNVETKVESVSTGTPNSTMSDMEVPFTSQESKQEQKVEPACTEPLKSIPDDSEVPFTGEEFVDGFSIVLTCWIQQTARKEKPPKVSHFHSVSVPGLSIQDYLKRIRRFFHCSLECYAIALVLIDRAGKADPTLAVCDLNVHRLLVTAIMLAAKFHDDDYYGNNYYAKVGGLGLKEINHLEQKLLKLLNWQIRVTPEEYEEYLKHVRTAIGVDTTMEETPPLKTEP